MCVLRVFVFVLYSRHTDEGCVAAIEEGAVEHLHDEGEILKRQIRDGGADREHHTLQRRQEERQHRGPQVGFLFTLSYKQTRKLKNISKRKSEVTILFVYFS